MIPYDIDPSLHDAEPAPEQLEDGFSPPHPDAHAEPQVCEHAHQPELALGPKSPF